MTSATSWWRRALSHALVPKDGSRRSPWFQLFLATSVLALVIGLPTAGLGVWLVSLGGNWFYLFLGLALSLAGLLGVLRHRRLPALILAATAGATILWSLVEIGLKGWMPAWPIDLAARSGVVVAIAALALVAHAMERRDGNARRLRIATFGGLGAGLCAVGLLVALGWERPRDPGAPAEAIRPFAADTDWTAFGGAPEGRRYSEASQITPQNVSALAEAWRFHTGDRQPNDRVFYAAQNTPLKIGDTLYLCSPGNKVFALDPATGAERWRFDPQVDPRAMESMFSAACRAVAYHEAPPEATEATCARRVFVAVADGRLAALDAGSGAACAGFGANGTVDLTQGMGLSEPGHASSNSGPAVVGDLVLVGQQVSDNQRRDAPSGVVRAYDARTGALRWAWDAKRLDRPREPLGEGETWPEGTPNVWNVISGDTELGLVFLGTGNPGNDHWGGDRDPADDEYASAVVAVDLAGGETRWHFRTVLNDRFDYDIGAQPVVADVAIDGAPRRAVIQATKTGSLFVLDAATGEPLRPVEMVPAPQGSLAGETLSPVQPQSTFFPNLSGLPGRDPERIDASHAFGVTPIDAALCRVQFHRMRYEGLYTPPTDEGLGTLLFPGTIGGPNWGGIAVDEARGIAIGNHSRLANRVEMIRNEDFDETPIGDGGRRPDQDVAPQAGAPWGVDRPIWLSPLGVPCIAPPWGFLWAVDLATGGLLWSEPFGTGFDMGPLGLPTLLRVPMGTPNLGGAVVTGSGLAFIAAAQDDFIRAYETRTGRMLWSARLPAGGQAGAMTYMHEGRQYVAIVATGHGQLQTTQGDALVVYALPTD